MQGYSALHGYWECDYDGWKLASPYDDYDGPDMDAEYEQWLDEMDAAAEVHNAMTSDPEEWHYLNAFDDDASDTARHMWPDDSWFEMGGRTS